MLEILADAGAAVLARVDLAIADSEAETRARTEQSLGQPGDRRRLDGGLSGPLVDRDQENVMITEIAQIEVLSGEEAAFEAAVAEAAPLFRGAKGCRHMRLERSVEQPRRYRLFVAWDTVEDHMVHFRESSAFARWRELVGPHFAEPPAVEHVSCVLDAF